MGHGGRSAGTSLDLIKLFPTLPRAVKGKGGGLGLSPSMSLLCVPGLASAVTRWPLPELVMPTWGLSLGIESWAGWGLLSCLMTNTDSLLTRSHSFAFYQEGDNECAAIDFQGISALRDRESIIWIRNTFLSLIN